MTSWSTIPCTEVHGSRQEGRSWKNGPRCSVQLRCDYDNRFLLSEDLFLNGYWPFTPGSEAAPRVQDIQIAYEPSDYLEDGQTIVYKNCILTVQYGFDDSAGQQQGGGAGGGRQLYTESIEPQLEIFSIMDFDFFYQNDAAAWKLLDEKNIPTSRSYKMHVSRTFYNWVSVPISFLDLQGSVNDAEVTMLGLTFPAETLMFAPQSISRSLSSTGTDGFTVNVKFSYNKSGWNKFPIANEATGRFTSRTLYLRPKDTALPRQEFVPYPLEDFSDWVF